jgi:putative inorganic carbon (HCO3(-)) transporter
LVKLANKYFVEFLTIVFIGLIAYTLVYKKDYFYIVCALPIILTIVYLAIFKFNYLVYFLAFCTPLAVTLQEIGLTTRSGPNLSLPSEPIMIGIMFLYILNNIYKPINDKKFLTHPLSYLILAQIIWMAITIVTSTEIIISIKYLISRLWYVFSCYLIIPLVIKNKTSIVNFILSYAISLGIVIVYTLINHAKYNFNDKAADWIVSPFYNDHTAYGAALSMYIPMLVCLLFVSSVSKTLKIIIAFLFVLFSVGLVASFARAGWLSLVIVLFVWLTILLKIKFRTLLITFITLITLFLAFRIEIFMVLGRNNTDAEGGLANNIESISNISTDASNLERLNRWSCALRMWQDKPVFGWGPGTYMFKYAPYQLSSQRTIISTNFGTNGNAHSEYLGPLAEQGVLGILGMLAMLIYIIWFGYKLAYRNYEKDIKLLTLGLFFGLITYLVHGFLNNFLDTDKLSLPFWGFLGILVCIDLYYTPEPETSNKDVAVT